MSASADCTFTVNSAIDVPNATGAADDQGADAEAARDGHTSVDQETSSSQGEVRGDRVVAESACPPTGALELEQQKVAEQKIPRDLDRLVLACLAKNPAD